MELKIDRNALFSDESETFVSPVSPRAGEQVKVRLWAKKDNLTSAKMIIRGEDALLMKLSETGELFDVYEAVVPIGKTPLRYHFAVEAGEESCFYERFGAVDTVTGENDFLVVPDLVVPDWARGNLYYQIFPDRFCNGDPTNDVVDDEYTYIKGAPVRKVTDWNKVPDSKLDVGNFYGGDLQGVLDKLDLLKHRGIETIYLNPIFVSPSNHKYDIQDYDHVDPHFGVILPEKEETPLGTTGRYKARVTDEKNLTASDELLVKLVKEAHARGMRVILDGVFNHCGSYNKWMDRPGIYADAEGGSHGAYADRRSPYHTYFTFKKGSKWPDNDKYKGWWDMETLPKLNYEKSPELVKDVLRIARKWVSEPFCLDGWRLDVAADLGETPEFNHTFWKAFREAVREANPNAVVLAEHYGDPSSWLTNAEWDTVMNYDGFMEPVTWYLTGMEKHSDRRDPYKEGDTAVFLSTMKKFMNEVPQPCREAAMNELSNHDHSRFLTRTNRRSGRTSSLGPAAASEGINKGIFREAVVLQMTWIGSPAIYYGDEAGLCGFTDPDSRRTYPWNAEDFELVNFHAELSRLHRESVALRRGAIKPLITEKGLLCYGRFTEDDRVVVAINHTGEDRVIHIPAWQIGCKPGAVMNRRMTTGIAGYNVGNIPRQVDENGCIRLAMPPFSAYVYRERPEQ